MPQKELIHEYGAREARKIVSYAMRHGKVW